MLYQKWFMKNIINHLKIKKTKKKKKCLIEKDLKIFIQKYLVGKENMTNFAPL